QGCFSGIEPRHVVGQPTPGPAAKLLDGLSRHRRNRLRLRGIADGLPLRGEPSVRRAFAERLYSMLALGVHTASPRRSRRTRARLTGNRFSNSMTLNLVRTHDEWRIRRLRRRPHRPSRTRLSRCPSERFDLPVSILVEM